ncbi:TonB-dependent receptor [Qipengyuania sp. GH25]|uniref:TonB-dependent receptor n=1 Tax=Qipengyuania pacifica TaxID=2860199 RepID=A0ABS7JK67_9SPHN|nr:TonB-dependent receptor [Qipengyuania aerophila]MBX7489787.1 TonB-dependent receptor [Qipengyuania aerophila]
MKTFLAVSTALAASWSNPAVALENDDEDATIVVVGDREAEGEEELRNRPGGIDLVTAEDFEDKQAVSLRDALALSPGVYAQPRFGQEIRLSIRGSGISRGYHMRGITLLQDGVPINLADDNGDFQELDPSVLDRLEVYRGANAFRFGGATLGGAINGVTPRGRDASGIALRVVGGSFHTLRGQAEYGFARDSVDGWLAISGDWSDGEREHAERRGLRINGNFGLALSDNVNTRFYVNTNTIRQKLPGSLPYDAALSTPERGNFLGDQARDIDSLRLQSRTLFDLDAIELEAGAFINAKSLYHPIFQVVDQKSLDRGVFARAVHEAGAVRINAGVTARFGSNHSRRFINIGGERGALTFDAELDATTIDAYGEVQYEILSRMKLIAGGVYTHGTRTQEIAFPAKSIGRASFDQFSPRIGALWSPRDDVEVFANFSRSHELPGFIELAQISSFVPLAPQRAWSAEAGARGRYGAIDFDLTAYRAKVTGEMLQYTVNSNIPASTFNAERTIHQGIELGLGVQIASWLSARGTYTYNDFRFEGDSQYGDNRLPVIPRHVIHAEARLGPESWHLSPSVEWVPQGAFADYSNTFRTAGYASLGLTASCTIFDQIEVFADARNLLDHKAIGDISAVTSYRFDDPTTPWNEGSSIFNPIERRAVFIGVRARIGSEG